MKETTTKRPGRLRAAVLSWLGLPIGISSEFDSFWASWGTTQAGQTVNDTSILKLSAVWACARLIAETISTLPLGLYQRTEGDSRIAVKDHPVYPIIHSRPNRDSTATVFWESMVASMLLRGNGFAEMLFVGPRLVGLAFIPPSQLTISMKEGRRVYVLRQSDGTYRDIPESRIFRIPGFTTNGDWGLSVVEYGAGVFGSALAAAEAANGTFERGLMPSVYFKTERLLQKEQRETFRTNLADISGALNAGKSPLLEGGMEAGTIGINPSDAQLLESRAFSVEEICRWFRVPPFMVGHSEKSTSWGTGIEQQMIGFLTFTLRPWLTRIEQAIHKDLLSPVDQVKYYAEYSVEGLLRADSAGRASYLVQMVNNGLMTRDEGRAKENLPRKGGNADVLTVQTALTPLDKLGEAAAAPVAPAAPEAPTDAKA